MALIPLHICRHFTVFTTVAELEQMRKGLSTLGFLGLMEEYEELMAIFQPSTTPISAATIEDFFTVGFAEIGSNDRVLQEGIMFNWWKYLRDIEEGRGIELRCGCL